MAKSGSEFGLLLRYSGRRGPDELGQEQIDAAENMMRYDVGHRYEGRTVECDDDVDC